MVLPGLIAAFRSLAFEAPARSVLVDGSEAISATPSTMLLAYDSHGIAGPPTCRDSSGAPEAYVYGQCSGVVAKFAEPYLKGLSRARFGGRRVKTAIGPNGASR